jgi:hypothetical protein
LLALFIALGGLPKLDAALALALVGEPLAGARGVAPYALAEPPLLEALAYGRGNLVSTSGG